MLNIKKKLQEDYEPLDHDIDMRPNFGSHQSTGSCILEVFDFLFLLNV
jgi:hypothetical protein